MADEIDFTQKRMDAELASTILNRIVYVGESAHECDCGEEIPQARRLAVPGVQTCVACAELVALAKAGVRRV